MTSAPAVNGYRPALDGIRALAILLVLIQHALQVTFNAGGTGVAIFFALSGYLITGILLDEREKTGTIAIRQFYWRRFARLLPALLVVVLVADIAFLLLRNKDAIIASVLSVVYLMNYAIVLRGNYLPAFGHTWSLAVEEHFYLVWPILLLLLLGWKRMTLRRLLIVALALCFSALALRGAEALLGFPPRLAYIGSVERADALLYGAAAAMGVRLGWRPPVWLLLPSFAFIALYLYNPEQGHTVFLPALAGVGSALLVACVDYSNVPVLRKALSLRPMVFVGVVSYGVYLWHGPLLEVVPPGPDWVWLRIGMAGVAVLIAWLSYRFVERPIRVWARTKRVGAPRAVRPVETEPTL